MGRINMKKRLLSIVLLLIGTTVSAHWTELGTLQQDETELHYWLTGEDDAPLVVFTHGATMDQRMFEEQVEALAEDYRVLTWDVRGHGLSQPLGDEFSMEQAVDDLFAILDEIDADEAVFVGQSMGGYITQYAYLEDPERFLGMVIIGATDIDHAYSELEIVALQATNELFGIIPYGTFARLTATAIAVNSEVRVYAYDAILQVSQEDFATIWAGIGAAITTEGIDDFSIEVPLLLTHGDQDNAGSIQVRAPLWAEKVDDVVYEVIPEAGHNANQDNPEFFNDLLLDWLDTIFDDNADS